MKKIITILLCTFSLSVAAQDINLDSLYKCLDDAITHKEEYVAVREKRIKELCTRLNGTSNNTARYDILYDLYKEYKSYRNDSALIYIGECINVAEAMGDVCRASHCRVLQGYQCSSSGFYAEAFRILAGVDTANLDRKGLCDYYVAQRHLYGEMRYYTQIKSIKLEYEATMEKYRDKLMATLPKDDDDYLQCLEMEYYRKGNARKALEINDRRMKKLTPESREFAIVAFYRFLDCRMAGQMELATYWLVQSAICDVRHAVMDQGSMWEVANILSDDEHQLQRSYRYISFAWECAERFGTRVRNMQIASVFSTIDKIYQEANLRKANQMRLTIAVTSILALLILSLFLYVNRQRRHLVQAKKELSDKNMQLSEVNTQLHSLNGKLSEVNANLHDSNRVKDEYIGRFLRLCSMYIDKMDGLRKRVNKLIKSRDFEELGRMLRVQESKDKELDGLYNDFDTAFLHLYPNFVEEFNAMLREEERIVLADKNVLNTPIRIFALIRLGIDDSSKIAEFLHYSVNTIYNYRARIKNGALENRESFEKRVKQIGLKGDIKS